MQGSLKALLVTPSCLTQQALAGLLAPLSLVTRSYTSAQQQLQQQQQQSATQQALQQRSTVHGQLPGSLLEASPQQQAAHCFWHLHSYTTSAAAAAQHTAGEQGRHRQQLQQQLDDKLQDDPQRIRRPRADSWRQKRHGGHQQEQRQQHAGQQPRTDSWRAPRQQQQQLLQPAVITDKMMKAESPQKLLELVVQHSSSFNRIHVVAALNKAAELWPAAAAGTAGADSEKVLGRQQLQRLVAMLAGPFARSMVHCTCREISSGLWAYATCQLQAPPALLAAAADAICGWDKLQGGEAKHLVSLSWTLAKLGCKERPVLAALAAALAPQAGELSANQMSVVLWAFGKSGFRDQHLLEQLGSRTRQLLQEQLQQQQQQQVKLGRAAARQLKHAQFDAQALTNAVWGMSALHWHDPPVIAAAASLAGVAPVVYKLRPYEAVHLLKGFAASGAAAAEGEANSDAESSSSSSVADEDAAVDQQVQEELEQPSERVAAAAVPNRQLAIQLWPAACAVASAALRRLDEATPQCVVRLMWALSALHQAAVSTQQQHPQQGPPLSAAATEDGRVVFGQLAAALQQQWSRQAPPPVGLAVAAWSLVAAQDSRLLPGLLLLQQPGQGGAAGHAAAVLQQLLQVTVAAASEGQLKVHQVADLAAAFDRLSRPLQLRSSSLAAPEDSSSSTEPQGLHSEPSTAAAAGAEGQPAAEGGEQQPLLGQFAAAVAALADAAERMAAAAEPGQLSSAATVLNVNKMLVAFGRMQVTNEALFQALLSHWTPQQLQSCNNETLVAAARAASRLASAQPSLVSSGVLSVDVWQQLLQLCMKRWGRLSTRQQAALQAVSDYMPAEIVAQRAEVAAEFKRVVSGMRQ